VLGLLTVKSAAMAPPREYPIRENFVQGRGEDWRHRKIWEV